MRASATLPARGSSGPTGLPSLKRFAQPQPIKPGVKLTLLLAALASTGPVSTDFYLPSLPAIAEGFSAPASYAQVTLSIFLAGFAVAQPLYGPLSDRYGRRPVILGALVAYILASLLCAFAPNLEMLIAARFLQGAAGGAPMVVVRATVRDSYPAERQASALAAVSSVMALGPMMAPALGGVVETALSWRAAFAGLSIFGVFLLFLSATKLSETLNPAYKQSAGLSGILSSYGVLLRDQSYRWHILVSALSFAGLFVLVSASPVLLQDVLGLTPVQFGLVFAYGAGSYAVGAMTGGRLSRRMSSYRLIAFGVSLEIFAGVMMIALALGGVSATWAVALPQALYSMGAGFVFPQAVGAALRDHPKRAGAASSMQSMTSLGCAGLAALLALAAVDGARGFSPTSAQAATGAFVLLSGLAATAAFLRLLRILARMGSAAA